VDRPGGARTEAGAVGRAIDSDTELPVARCFGDHNPLYAAYHDEEWGVPVHDDRVLFEFLILEGAQAGLSWEIILRKREHYRESFAGFDPAQVARFTPKRIERLMLNPGLVRNRLKIEGTVKNARAFLEVQKERGSFSTYAWDFVGNQPRQNAWKSIREIPARTAESDALSKDLKKRGFTFVGSTIMYAWMQAVGLVNDHALHCPRWKAVQELR
jgi:DNA-3-methyladenine glycosylase I